MTRTRTFNPTKTARPFDGKRSDCLSLFIVALIIGTAFGMVLRAYSGGRGGSLITNVLDPVAEHHAGSGAVYAPLSGWYSQFQIGVL